MIVVDVLFRVIAHVTRVLLRATFWIALILLIIFLIAA